MSRVDFYVLADQAPDARLRYACHLAEQAVQEGRRVYLQTSGQGETQRLDDLLWTFNDRSFLPHEIHTAGSAPKHERVMILLGEASAPPSHRALLVNLTADLPAELPAYERIAEIVDADPGRKQRARERYRLYRERGCALESHNVSGE